MRLYEYPPLLDETHIRLVTILPGDFSDSIRLEITQEPLTRAINEQSTSSRLRDAQKSVAPGWAAYETLEGHIITWNGAFSRWVHDDPDKADRVEFERTLDPLFETEDEFLLAYEALSYTWGSDKGDEVAIVVNSDMKEMPLGANLANAIRYLRYPDRPRIMWIDAVCIDQTNYRERGQQVQRMGDIYLHARKVVAWLGSGTANTELAFSALNLLGESVVLVKGARFMLPRPYSHHTDWHRREFELDLGVDELNAIEQVCLSEYFTRLWIVQEIQLGNARAIIKAGNDEIPWPFFRSAIACIGDKVGGIPQSLRQSIIWPKGLCMSLQSLTLHELLYDYRQRNCKDDRDKIYGLMKLFDPEVSERIAVDYSETNTAMETFKQIFVGSLEEEDRLSQLPFGGIRHLEDSADAPLWPTWLPDWSHSRRTTVPPSIGFCASGVSAAHAQQLSHGRFEVMGVRFASVSTVGATMSSSPDIVEIAEVLGGLDFKKLQISTYPTGETHLDAYLHTLSMGQLKDRMNDQKKYPSLNEVRIETSFYLDTPPAAYYQHVAANWLRDCCIFTLSNGYVGLIYGKPQIGDEVFVMLGCDAPMLLRARLDGSYEVVGDCYVHGIMDGEVILGPLSQSWSVEIVKDMNTGKSRQLYHSVAREPKIRTYDDPRLASVPLPLEWEPVAFEWTRKDPIHCKKFKSKKTGRVINSDPRLFSEALRARGVSLETITLV
ncbi:HET-domain-containing protein [Xylariaceae sp. FL1019]|nr:HET-domain-containing protein [Xylariaceae sp. FL1019]